MTSTQLFAGPSGGLVGGSKRRPRAGPSIPLHRTVPAFPSRRMVCELAGAAWMQGYLTSCPQLAATAACRPRARRMGSMQHCSTETASGRCVALPPPVPPPPLHEIDAAAHACRQAGRQCGAFLAAPMCTGRDNSTTGLGYSSMGDEQGMQPGAQRRRRMHAAPSQPPNIPGARSIQILE